MKKLDTVYIATHVSNIQSTFILKILEKIIETRLKFSQGSVTVLKKIANYQETRVKLTSTQLIKLKLQQKIRQEQY